MNFIPRPRILFFIALGLAIPTWGVSLVIFYVLFKRPYDSAGLSAIFAAAKLSMEQRRAGRVSRINRGAISRVFWKFGDPNLVAKYGQGAPFVHWGVLTHPMLNGGKPFTLRVNCDGDTVHVEASPGVAWWLLTDQVWLGRLGTAPGLPASVDVFEKEFTEPRVSALYLLILDLVYQTNEVELASHAYEDISDLADQLELWPEYFGENRGMRFWPRIKGQMYELVFRTTNPDQGDASSVLVSAVKMASSKTLGDLRNERLAEEARLAQDTAGGDIPIA